jgi:kynureninase
MTSAQATDGAASDRNHGPDRLLNYRERFPILERTNYLISNSLGAVPAAVGPSLQSYYASWAERGVRAWEEGWWSMAADLGDLVAPLIGANTGEVVFQPNVTLAHAVVFSAIDYGHERNKFVTDSMHFPSILYLIDQQRRLGADVTVVPSDDGISVDTQRMIDAIDERTAIVNVSHVLFKSAYIHDVAAIAEKARQMQAIMVADGYQAVGTIPVDVRSLGIDVYIGGCLKWLCGGPGNAFIWVDPTLRRRLQPKLTGWMAHQQPFSFAPDLARRDDAWRVLHGTPNISGLYAARPGLEIINEIGIDAIRAKSMKQTTRLLELAEDAGFRCTTPRDPARRAGTVAIDVENGYEISRSLKSREILCDYRPGAGIRLSPHFYNRDDELETAMAAINEIRKSGEWKAHAAERSAVT